MNTNCLEILGLNYKNIFKNFSIAFENNHFITITGPNNCGKTTLLRIIGCEVETSNTVLLYGNKIENYKVTELNKLIKTVFPLEITFTQRTVEEELLYQLSLNLSKEVKQKILKKTAQKFKITKILTKTTNSLSNEEIIRVQLSLAMINKPKILLLDNLNSYFNKKDLIELIRNLKTFLEEDLTIIMTTNNLDCALESDYLYVIDDSKIILEGEPLKVLEKDNILNKIGLELPFMIDLSVKLRDYDLIKQLELDMERMVNTLWS